MQRAFWFLVLGTWNKVIILTARKCTIFLAKAGVRPLNWVIPTSLRSNIITIPATCVIGSTIVASPQIPPALKKKKNSTTQSKHHSTLTICITLPLQLCHFAFITCNIHSTEQSFGFHKPPLSQNTLLPCWSRPGRTCTAPVHVNCFKIGISTLSQ